MTRAPRVRDRAERAQVVAPSAPVVAIGGSVGALPAFTELLRHVPGDTGLSFVFVQHLDPKRDSLLVQLLSGPSCMPVRKVEGEMRLEPNEVYVVPSAHAVAYADGRFRLGPRGCTAPSVLIDGFMQSLASAQGSRAVGVVLSGNGRDGVEGLAAIRREGGVTFCQRPASARSDAMPRAAIAAGVVDFVLDPVEIALELVRVAKTLAGDPSRPTEAAAEQADLERLFALVRVATGVDFGDYKRATVRRRIERRMRYTGHSQLSRYLEHVRTDATEAAALHADLLIGVTRFFRDARTFAALKRAVLPPLVQACADGRVLRIWVAGCATGQEPYSIAMCALECLGEHPSGKSIQIFATDVREDSIARARAGLYPESIGLEMSAERLRRFFVKRGDGYQISRAVRELCVFARHDVLCDPGFSRLDLISCRNVLIYLGLEAQQRVLSKFRHALGPHGLLLLGGSESVSSQSPLFERVDQQERLYRPRAPAGELATRPENAALASSRPAGSSPCIMPGMSYDARKEADRVLLGRFVSAAILVDSQLQVIQFRGRTGPFMAPLSGAASLNVLTLVETALLPALRYGIASVQRTKRTYRRQGFVVELEGVSRALDIEIVPLRAPQSNDLNCLIVFTDAPNRAGARSKSGAAKSVGGRLMAQLREELAMTRDHLQASLTEQESSNESLRATLEELQSTNEELQVTNEELETGKEELQSANEELMTASDEVQMRNAELSQLMHDQVNLVAAANVSAVLIGADMRLRRVTPVAANQLRLTATDIGRPISELQLGLHGCDLPALLTDAIAGLAHHNVAAHDAAGHRYSLAVRPYQSVDGHIDGVVMTISDVTALRATEDALMRAEQRILALESAAVTSKLSN